jgi:uncharacterized membrane protein
MTLKQYSRIRIVFAIVIAIVVSQSLVYNNFLIPIAVIIIVSLALMYFRGKVKEIVADERDYAIGGKSALLAMQIFSWLAVICMLVLYALRDRNPTYEAIGMTLAFSTCILMLLYSAIFRFYNKIKFTDKKVTYLILVLLLFLVVAIAGLRLFSGEDDWNCQNGQWIQHGHPSFPAPTIECK